ncbi:hypothetical protein BY996DRAFT_8538970 [Phakopsora pachyrhizi]|nr:hypothetical protein BY996DRAFT_8538970 [Phakopsora pachyrhizi]
MNLTPQLGARIGGLVGGQSESSHTESKAQSIPQLQDQFSAVNQSTLVVNLKFEQNLDGDALIAASSVFSEIVAKGPTSNKVPENVTDMDITDTGIDPTFLEALPDDTRREVSNLHIQEQRPAREELYAPIQAEVIRSKLERRNTTSGNLDPATFFASLDPTLSKAVLLDQDKGCISTLPQNILAEVDALCDRLSLCHHAIRLGHHLKSLLVQELDHSGIVIVNFENSCSWSELIRKFLGLLQDVTQDFTTIDQKFFAGSNRAIKALVLLE